MLATEQSMIKEKNQKEIRKYLERNENGTKNFRMWQKIGGKKVKVEVPQLCPILCDPMDYIVHGILQARILEWWLFPSPGDLPNPGIELRSPALQADSLPSEPPGKPVEGKAANVLTHISNIEPGLTGYLKVNYIGRACLPGYRNIFCLSFYYKWFED